MCTEPRWRRASGHIGDRAAASFTDRFGGAPDGIWAAPGRVNLIGEHVDYNAGRCLPLALPHRTACAARRRADGALHVVAGDRRPWIGAVEELAPSSVEGWARYAAGAIWAMRGAGADVGGLDLAIESDVPIGAGLSSSAALICAVAVAAADLAGWADTSDAEAVARLTPLCIAAETKFVGAPTGGMDQAAALRSRAGHVLLLDCRDDSAVHVTFEPAASDLALIAIDTGVVHRNSDGRYGARRDGCERAARTLGVGTLRDVADAGGDAVDDALRLLDGDDTLPLARHVLTEMHRVDTAVALLGFGVLEQLGEVLDVSHRSLRDDFAVSCPELDLAVEVAREAAALGARMTGGGFGGSAIALVPAGAEDAVACAVDRAFAEAGFGRPAFLVAEAAGPAARLS